MATAILNGTITDDGGLDCEGRFQYGLTQSFGFNTAWKNNLRTDDTFQELINNLLGGTTYYFRAQARNALGTTNGLTLTFVTIPRAPIVLSLPATAIGTTSAILNGKIIEDMGAGCETRFEWGGTATYGMTTKWVFGSVTGSTFEAEISALRGGATYHYRAVARNRYGIGYGQDVVFGSLDDLRVYGTGFQQVLARELEVI